VFPFLFSSVLFGVFEKLFRLFTMATVHFFSSENIGDRTEHEWEETD